MHSSGCPRNDCRPILAAARLAVAALVASLLLLTAGCANRWVSLRSVPRNPLGDELQLGAWGGPKPSERTAQLLRVHNLADDLPGDRRQLLEKLQPLADREHSAETVYAMSELAYLGGKRVEKSQPRLALDLYGAAVLHAYQYLFDPRFARTRNCYDPQFRGACELYNGALESALRIVCANRELVPGTTSTIHTATGEWDITCIVRGGRWRAEDFDRFEFASDYEMKGLTNHYQSHGLGVPLIAVRRSSPNEPAAARYYPPGLSFPVTALLRPLPKEELPSGQSAIAGRAPRDRHQGLLELYDPLATPDTVMAGMCVPLESDLTTPLAYFLAKVPLESLGTVGLLRPDKLLALRSDRQTTVTGLYMAQPYEPDKIPVVLVHGLWSSPMTWMQMFNDLRSSPDICRHYQIWFYLYPTAQPFWCTAAQLRRDLAEVRQTLDPEHRQPALDQMVLVGHSMGGLVAKLQTLDSRDDYWGLASRVPLDQIKTDPETRQKLLETFYFQPNPAVRRVITIGTPHRGSKFSNETTQYLAGKLIHLPGTLVSSQQQLLRDNPQLLFDRSILKIETSVDALAPDSTIFPVMLSGRRAPW